MVNIITLLSPHGKTMFRIPVLVRLSFIVQLLLIMVVYHTIHGRFADLKKKLKCAAHIQCFLFYSQLTYHSFYTSSLIRRNTPVI